MFVLQENTLAPPVPCPYLADRNFVQEYFLAFDLTAEELDELLARGWRRFGLFFFRPQCPDCRACRPIRVNAAGWEPSRGQKRVLRRNEKTEMTVNPLAYRPELYSLYRKHTELRFDQDPDGEEEFRDVFFTPAVPAVQTEYHVDGDLAGAGWLDWGAVSLSSVYFVFDPAWGKLSLGTYSVIREIQTACREGLSWYYLGYWIEENPSMAYKARFGPHQLYDWDSGRWD